MSTQSGYTQSGFSRTLDGLLVLEADEIQLDGQTVILGNYFDKTVDTSDDITEGAANLFLTPTERADIAANTAARHAPVTIGTANGLSLGGVSGQEISLGLAGLLAPGAISAATYLDIQVAKAAAHPRLTLSPTMSNGLQLDLTNQILGIDFASAASNGSLSSNDWTTFNSKESALTFSAPLARATNTISIPQASAVQDGYLASNDWTTFNSKQNVITGGATTITTANLTASRALVSDGSGKVAVSTVTSTELGYVAGVTSSIQSQLNALAGASPWQEIVTPGGSFIRTSTIPATVEVNDRLAVTGNASFTGRVAVGNATVPTSYQLEVTGSGRFTAALDAGLTSITQNGANTRFIGTDHCYLEMYPRGLGSGRKAFMGFGGVGVTDLSLFNQDAGKLILGTNSTSRLTITNDGKLGVNTETPSGKMHVVMGDTPPLGVVDWDDTTAVFGQNGSRSGAVGIGYNAAQNAGVLSSLAPGVAWKDMYYNANRHLFYFGSNRRFLIENNGTVYQANGDNSWTEYGPNWTWGSKLREGATPDIGESTTAQVITTNGSLHLDAGRDARDIYLNYYAAISGDDNDMYQCSRREIMWHVALGRSYEAPTPIRLIMYNYNEVSPVFYAPGVNFWGVLLPNIFQIAVDPLRTSSRFLIRVKLSVALYGESSIAFRVTRTIGGGAVPINVGTGGINSGNSRMCGVNANSGYWMVPPTYIEVLDHPNTTSQVIYRVEYMTYSPAYGFRLNLPNPGSGQGGDATAVTSVIVVEERAFSEYSQRVATNPP